MDFKEFNRLYRKDTISFLIALNLYLGYGATVLRAGSKEDLSGAAALEISGLFAAEKRDHIIETVRKLAEMDPNDLIPYISQCGIRAGASSSDEPGVCPVCGGRIKYDHEGSSEWNFILTWHCLDCGATGEENHHLVFDAHYSWPFRLLILGIVLLQLLWQAAVDCQTIIKIMVCMQLAGCALAQERLTAQCASSEAGSADSVTTNVVPTPTWLDASIFPP